MAQGARKSIPPESPTWMIKTSDISEVKFVVSCTNTTTKTDVTPASVIELVEISPQGLLLKLPARSCAYGHMLIVLVERRRSKPFFESASKEDDRKRKKSLWAVEDKVQFTAKVIEVEPHAAGKTATVSVQFYQWDKEHWKRFLEELGARQRSVTNLVRRMSE